jgi:uncharacterized circularly permuted ATP-grasp superfamily protein
MLQQFSEEEFKEKHDTAQLSFLRQGITFTVYGEKEGTERTMPFDFVPIIIPAEKWNMIEKGMIQRVEALNLFLEGYLSGSADCQGRCHPEGTH